jgi:outer membrane receptor for ferrienterochelin and colicin
LKFFSIRNRRVRGNCVSSTRSSRTIKDIPTRIEFIAGEELEEKANMKAGDIRMLLSESTGIQTQQTSATSANASIRIQGLDGDIHKFLKTDFRYMQEQQADLDFCKRHRLT